MMPTMTDQHHQWVKHTVTDVSTLPDIDEPEKVVVIEDPRDVATAEEGAVYGCKVCHLPLEGNADTLCRGSDVEE
jgi:hypothetical protein